MVQLIVMLRPGVDHGDGLLGGTEEEAVGIGEMGKKLRGKGIESIVPMKAEVKCGC